MATIHLGDCRDVLATIADNSIDSIVTDPPYELGFMGKKWDSTGIAYDVTVWQQCLRVLKPGGHLIAFGVSPHGCGHRRCRLRDT
jgi:site-specific DNA-methyltransferase (adenine-specific)